MKLRYLRAPFRSVRPGTARRRRIASPVLVFAAVSIFLAAAAAQLSAQQDADHSTGIMGSILNSETGEPMGYANLVFSRTDVEAGRDPIPMGGVISHADGSYRKYLPSGVYRIVASYISYNPLTVTDVVVEQGRLTEINLTLTPSEIRTFRIEVTADEVRSTETALLAQRKRSAATSDGISADQIRKTADSDAGDVLARVTGVTLVDDRFVYVRGMGERYSAVRINGAGVASPEPNRKVLPLDLFPAKLLDQAVIQKTFAPDMEGDFGGGLVDLKFLEFPGNRQFDFSFQSGYETASTGETFLTCPGGKHDWLGFDDGTRDLPDLMQEMAGSERVRRGSIITPGQGFTVTELKQLARSFNKNWTSDEESAIAPLSFSTRYADEVNLFGKELGYIGSVVFKSGNDVTTWEERYHQGSEGSDLNEVYDYAGADYVETVDWTTLANANLRLDMNNKMALNLMYNRSADDMVREYEGEANYQGKPVRVNRFQYVERGLLTGTVGMDHHLKFMEGLGMGKVGPFDFADSEFKWLYGYSEAERNEPDRREYTYERSSADTTLSVLTHRTGGLQPNRFYQYMDDFERSFNADYVLPAGPGKVGLGYAHRNKDRYSDTRRFSFNRPLQLDSAYSYTDPMDMLMVDTLITLDNYGWRFEEVAKGTDDYTGVLHINSYYGLYSFEIKKAVRVFAGARVEN